MEPRDPDRLTTAPDGRPAEAQPRWRNDFPIDWPQDRYVSQRDFIKFLLLTSLAFVAGQLGLLARSLFRRPAEAPRQAIARIDDVPVGGFLVFHYPGKNEPRLLVRLDQSNFVAFDQRCTHLTCPVIPRPEDGELYCPCHVGRFELTSGRPVAGPPRRPLPRVVLEVRGGSVYAVGIETTV